MLRLAIGSSSATVLLLDAGLVMLVLCGPLTVATLRAIAAEWQRLAPTPTGFVVDLRRSVLLTPDALESSLALDPGAPVATVGTSAMTPLLRELAVQGAMHGALRRAFTSPTRAREWLAAVVRPAAEAAMGAPEEAAPAGPAGLSASRLR